MTTEAFPAGRRAVVVWLTAVAVYFLAVFHRSSLGVAGIAASERFGISASQLGTFTMLQLLVYAAMQIPVGVLLDRYGARRLLLTGVVLMSLAQLGFALTGSYAGALAARVVVGIGDAMVFISVLRLVAAWFPPLRSPVITQLSSILGQLGSLASAVPLVAALSRFGWTATFLVAASTGALLGLLVLVIVRDSPPGTPPPRNVASLRTVRHQLVLAWRDPGIRMAFWSHFSTQFSANVVGLLWGFPFLVNGEGVGRSTAALLLSLLVVTMILGGPLIGWFIAHNPWQRSTTVLGIVLALATTWAVTLLWPGDAPLWLLMLVMLVTGLGAPGSMIGFDMARTFASPTRLGTATGVVNVGGFTASLLTVLGVGVLLDLQTPGASTDYAPEAYSWAMTVQFVPWVIGGLQVWRFRRRARVYLAETQPETHAWMTRRRRRDPHG